MRKIKVLWFTNTPSGASKILSHTNFFGGWLNSLEKELAKSKSIDLSICFYYKKKINCISANNVTYFPIKRKILSNKFLLVCSNIFNYSDDKRELIELKKIVEIVNPDIIHIHGTEDNFGLLTNSISNIPIIISIQGLLNPYLEMYYNGIPKFYSIFYEPIRNFLFFSSTFWNFRSFKKNSLRELKILKNTRYIIGRTKFDKSVTRLLAPNSVYFENNEILRDAFYKNKFPNKKIKGSIKVVSIISNGHYKGLETLVKSFYYLKRNTDLKISWNVIGLSKSDSYVKFTFNYLGISLKNSEIKFLGRKKPKEILNIFNLSDVYCQSSHIENSSNSLCEAMISGIPIIASFAGGTSSLFNDKSEGLLYQSGDSFSLAGCLMQINTNYENAISKAKLAKNRAISRHDKKTISENLIYIYDEIIKK